MIYRRHVSYSYSYIYISAFYMYMEKSNSIFPLFGSLTVVLFSRTSYTNNNFFLHLFQATRIWSQYFIHSCVMETWFLERLYLSMGFQWNVDNFNALLKLVSLPVSLKMCLWVTLKSTAPRFLICGVWLDLTENHH